jgi:hypothetical protein
MMPSRWLFPVLLAGLLLNGACRRDDHPDTSAATHVASSHHHEHIAPHGGAVVVLGDEVFHLELVHDPAVGRLTGYVLDGHMENFIRLPAPGIETSIAFGETNRTLVLTPIAQAATGETIGNTSQFAGEADWLKGATELNGIISSIEVRGQTFNNVAFRIMAGTIRNSQSEQ